MRIRKFLLGHPAAPITLAQTAELAHCANCTTPLQGKYCSACGQKRTDAHDYKVSGFVGHALHEFTHFDSKFFRTVKGLLLKPGYMTEEYLAGHRKKYMNPVQLFIVVNLFYFILLHFTSLSPFTTQLKYHMRGNFYSETATRLVEQKIHDTHTTLPAYEEQFNHAIQGQAKGLIIVMIPFLALVLGALYILRRRYFVEHLVFSLHFFSFCLLFFGLIPLVIIGVQLLFALVAGTSITQYISDEVLSLLSFSILLVYVFGALKRVYREPNLYTGFKTLLLIFGFGMITMLYRAALFFSTYYTLKGGH